jgi:hypothetical protein
LGYLLLKLKRRYRTPYQTEVLKTSYTWIRRHGRITVLTRGDQGD